MDNKDKAAIYAAVLGKIIGATIAISLTAIIHTYIGLVFLQALGWLPL